MSLPKTSQRITTADSLSAQFNKSLTLSDRNEQPGSPKLKNKPSESANDKSVVSSAIGANDTIPFVKPETKSQETIEKNTTMPENNKENSDVTTVEKLNTQQDANSSEDASVKTAKKNKSNTRPLRKPKILEAKEKMTEMESSSSSDVDLNCGPLRYMLATREKSTRACVGRGFALLYNNFKVWEDCEVKEDTKNLMKDYVEKYGYENEI